MLRRMEARVLYRHLAIVSILVCALSCTEAPAQSPCVPQDGGVEAGKVTTLKTVLAGVPAILRVPAHVTKPPIVLWHGLGPPASEGDLMSALPLDEVAAVKVYLGLPLFGDRAPSGGSASVAQRQTEDYASLIFEPVVFGAAKELAAVLKALRARKCLARNAGIGLFGFSAGAAAVLFELAEKDVPVRAAVTVNAPTSLNVSIGALERATKRPYAWTPHARELAERSDAVRRAGEIAAGYQPPALLIFHGADDAVISSQTAVPLLQALQPFYQRSGNDQRLKLVIAPGVAHDWTHPPALEELQAAVADWFNRYL